MCFRVGTITEINKDSFSRTIRAKAKQGAHGQKDRGRLARRQRSSIGKKELEPAIAA